MYYTLGLSGYFHTRVTTREWPAKAFLLGTQDISIFLSSSSMCAKHHYKLKAWDVVIQNGSLLLGHIAHECGPQDQWPMGPIAHKTDQQWPSRPVAHKIKAEIDSPQDQ